jgi:hypothetical protein
MTIDDRIRESATRLSEKYEVSFEEALQALVFFNGFLLHNYERHAAMMIVSSKVWKVSVSEMINTGLEAATRNIHLS